MTKTLKKTSANTTVITAFFDIGRAHFNYTNCEPRSSQKYLDYFAFWARIKNNLIVYTEPRLASKIRAIRDQFGLADRTQIIEIDDVFSIEPAIFARMQQIEQMNFLPSFRFFHSEVSNTAKYCYTTLMKFWTIQDAIRRKLCTGNLVWIDFGFNHGGECFANAADFNFELTHTPLKQVQLYTLPDVKLDQISAIDSLQFQFDSITGGLIALPTTAGATFYQYCKTSMESLLSLDCFDDDQQLLLMAAKSHPEFFDIVESDWFMPLKDHWGGEQLTLAASWQNREPKRVETGKLNRRLRTLKRRFTGDPLVSDIFIRRLDDKSSKYWPYR